MNDWSSNLLWLPAQELGRDKSPAFQRHSCSQEDAKRMPHGAGIVIVHCSPGTSPSTSGSSGSSIPLPCSRGLVTIDDALDGSNARRSPLKQARARQDVLVQSGILLRGNCVSQGVSEDGIGDAVARGRWSRGRAACGGPGARCLRGTGGCKRAWPRRRGRGRGHYREMGWWWWVTAMRRLMGEMSSASRELCVLLKSRPWRRCSRSSILVVIILDVLAFVCE